MRDLGGKSISVFYGFAVKILWAPANLGNERWWSVFTLWREPSVEDAAADLMRMFPGPCQGTFQNQVWAGLSITDLPVLLGR